MFSIFMKLFFFLEKSHITFCRLLFSYYSGRSKKIICVGFKLIEKKIIFEPHGIKRSVNCII